MSGINIENKEITATHAACKILSSEHKPPMDILVSAVPKLVEFLLSQPNVRLFSWFYYIQLCFNYIDLTFRFLRPFLTYDLFKLLKQQ